jgi:hypothetical protein
MRAIARVLIWASVLTCGASLAAQDVQHAPLGIVSDWAQRHVLYPESHSAFGKNPEAMSAAAGAISKDPRWLQQWYLRHPGAWWPKRNWPDFPSRSKQHEHRDWSVALATDGTGAPFGPTFQFDYDISPETGYGVMNMEDQGVNDEGYESFLAVAGSLTVTAGDDVGTYPLYPGGPTTVTSPDGAFEYDDLVTPLESPPIDLEGLLFRDNATSFEINIWGNSPGNYSYYNYLPPNYITTLTEDGSFSTSTAPGGGVTFPAKYVFSVNQAPSCANDFVVIGVPAAPASGGQANVVGVNNLYAGGAGALCPTGPTVMFAYASGTGEVPASMAIARTGTEIFYIENLLTGSSYFHALTLGTTGTNGTSATDAVLPGASGGNNALDQTVLLSPDGGVTNQSSTNSPFVVYGLTDATDFAYVTTYGVADSGSSVLGAGSGYLYKITNIYNGTPTIAWSVAINAIPSAPVYDLNTNKVFFTDSNGRIDYVLDSGSSPTVTYGPVVAVDATSENPVVIDNANAMVYASFNSNGSNAVVVQAPESLASYVSAAVGSVSTLYTSPYDPQFNNAFYTGSGTPLLYIAGTGTGSLPTLYSVGFNASGVMNSSANSTTAALATGMADSAPVTEFYNSTQGKDYLFASVTNNCVATTTGGSAGCIMSLDITSGFPTVNASTVALAATGGTTGIIVDNNSSATQASSVYFGTKTGATLVKATQSALQ